MNRLHWATVRGTLCSVMVVWAGWAMTHAEAGGVDNVVIQVARPAGAPPLGAPVETSIPLAQGQLKEPLGLAIQGPDGKPVVSQMRPAMRWPDGSIRWLHVVFEAAEGPGTYRLAAGKAPEQALLLLREEGEDLVVDTGSAVLRLPRTGPGWLRSLGARDANGAVVPIVVANDASGLVLKRADGTVFRSRLAGPTQKVVVEERGPVRASVRIEGTTRDDKGNTLFDTIARWQAYRGRSQVVLTVTWVNRTKAPGEFLRDVRVVFPFQFQPNRLVAGVERGVFDAPFLPKDPYFILQEDHDQYWARRVHTDGRILNLATGGANGHRAPGWLTVRNDTRCLGVLVPYFWQTYPNELAVKAGELSVGLWPERANKHLTSKPLLGPNPNPKIRYRHERYWPLMPHPYLAFFDPEQQCLDVPQGVAKTQDIILDVWAGQGEHPAFEPKLWKSQLVPVRGHLDPRTVARTGALGRIWPADPKHFPEAERTLAESFGWFQRHIDVLECYGKFDFGDFKYMTASPTYVTSHGKWSRMQEMAREGYWHNNERDQLLGFVLHYYRTGDPRAFEMASIVARHLLDVDIRHHPHYGMYTHSYGHCYRALGTGGSPDHAWLLGLLHWAGMSGDPVAWDWLMRCGDRLAGLRADFANTDLRTTSMQLHMMATFYGFTGDKKYLDAGRRVADGLLSKQRPDGSWSAYLNQPEKRSYPAPAFCAHAVMALADYYEASGDKRALTMLTKAIDWMLPPDKDEPNLIIWETPLLMWGLDVAGRATGDAKYADWARKLYTLLDKAQNRSPDPVGRGDFWAGWAVNNAEKAEGTGRPPQFCNQTRPLSPGSMLAYGIRAIPLLAEQAKLSLNDQPKQR